MGQKSKLKKYKVTKKTLNLLDISSEKQENTTMNRIFSLFEEKKFESSLALLGVIFTCILIFLLNTPVVDKRVEIQKKNIENPLTIKREKIAQGLLEDIVAKAFYVLDLQTGKVVFSKNETEKLPLASLTKLMSTLVISEKLPEFTSIPITKESIKIQGDSGLFLDEKWKLKDLIDFSLITSSNDGIVALSSVLNAFESSLMLSTVDLMNKKSVELGLTNTEFFNETGLDINPGKNGGYSSAKDTANLISYILQNKKQLLLATSNSEKTITSESNLVHIAKNTNELSEKIPSLIASKTGFTDFAGGNLVMAFEIGPTKPVVAVVMGSTIEGRFTDMENIVRATYNYYSDFDFNIK